jgi:hypothetical protein
MHAAIRQGKIKPGKVQEVTRVVREEALPRISAMHGFKALHFIVADDGTITVLNLFATAADANASNETMLPWVREHLGPLLEGPPSGTVAEVLVSKTVSG